MLARLCVLFVLINFVLAPGCGRGPVPEPIIIGHIATLSGPDKAAGEQARQGITLAVDEINRSENQVNGRPISVLHVDSRGDPAALQPAAVRLISVNRVMALVGGTEMATVERLGRAAQPYDIPLLSFAELPATPIADNVFSVNASLPSYARASAKFTAQELKASGTVVLINSRDPQAATFGEMFLKEFRAFEKGPAEERRYEPGADLAGLADYLKKANRQTLIFAGALSDLINAWSKLKSMGVTVPVLYGGSVLRADFVAAELEKLNDLYLTSPFSAEGTDGSAFAKAYTERFHASPDAAAALAYEAIHLVASALRRAGVSTPARSKELKAALLNPPESSEDGPGRFRFDKSQAAERQLFVLQVKDRQFHLVMRFDPAAK
jgi:branched-chain amino acid transport system substrate-binding protein